MASLFEIPPVARIGVGLAAVLFVCSGLATATAEDGPSEQGPSAVTPRGPARLLCVSVTTGFRHASIPAAEAALEEIGRTSGLFHLDFLRMPAGRPPQPKPPKRAEGMSDADWAAAEADFKGAQETFRREDEVWQQGLREQFARAFSAESLAAFDGLVFASTTGNLPLPDIDALLRWIKAGKAFIGFHAASDTLESSDAYVEMIGGHFAGHPWNAGGEHGFVVHDTRHPAAAMLPERFRWQDEIYQYDPRYRPENLRVLVSIDMAASTPQEPWHVPVAWVREYGRGKVFYSNFGHNEATWREPMFRRHFQQGIAWALGRTAGTAEPNPEIQAAEYLRSVVAAAAAATGADGDALRARADAKIARDPTWAVGLRPKLLELRSLAPAERAARYAEVIAAIEAAESAAVVAPPNIVLVCADDLGISDLGCYGRSEHRTPHLDRLAAEGVRFTAAYCAQPICSPSRAALMTGKCPARLNLTNYLPGRPDAPSQPLRQPRIEGFLPLEEVTIAELLDQAGYATGLFGKWHLGGPDHSPQRQGFDVVESPPANTTPTMDDTGLVTAGGKGELAITAAAEAFMEANRDRPFFCYVPHNNPHIPLAAPADLVARNRAAFHPTYAAMIETLDLAVGRLLAKVESLGLTERTIFIFTSDNGGLHVLESVGTPATHNRPYRAGKGYLYEGGLREPLLVRWPGVTQSGRVCDTPVVLTDLVPTLLEAAGIDPARAVGPLDGVSLTGLLRGDPLPPRPLFWHFPHYTNQGGRPAGAIREGDWKLVEQFEDGSLELYDLAADVGETRNLATAEPERAARMLAALRDWRARVGARMPTPASDFDAALHRRIYVDQDASRLGPAATATALEPQWQEWRAALNAATKGRTASVTPARGDIRLHARDARVHGETLRYEPQPNKDVLGFWTKPTDWADWEFEVATPGRYEVEIQQGCGGKSGGAEVAVEIGGGSGVTTLPFTVQETGHFQQMILRVIGAVELTAGRHTLAVKPRTKPGVAVMDLRRVVLRPVAGE